MREGGEIGGRERGLQLKVVFKKGSSSKGVPVCEVGPPKLQEPLGPRSPERPFFKSHSRS